MPALPASAAASGGRSCFPMSMLRTLFVLWWSALLLAQGEPNPAFTHEFGAPSATGSFRARFTPQGAGLVWLQAGDHFQTLAQARKAQKSGGDYLLLAMGTPVLGGYEHGLKLQLLTPTPAFPADLRTATWQVATAPDQLTFTLDGGQGLVLEKVLRHDPKHRGFVLELAIENRNATAVGSLDFELGGPMLIVPSESGLFGVLSVAIAAGKDGEAQHVSPQPGVVQDLPLPPAKLSFAGTTNRFFGSFLWPQDDDAVDAVRTLRVDTLPLQNDSESGTLAGTATRMRYGITLPIPAAGQKTTRSFGLYLGPKSYRVFKTLPDPERFAPILDVDLNAPCCFSITVPGGRPMAKLLLKLLGWFYDLVGNWGVAIMMLTILVRGLLLPLNFRMQKSMRAYSARMATLKPKLDALKDKHKDDQRAYQMAMVQFQREHKLLPPLGGCLPIFATMPIYLGLFTALRTAYDVRQQPFFGWMDDLSRPDALFALPFWPGQFNLLPVLWIGLMLIQMLRQPLPTDPQQRQQMQIMRYMPLIFGVMLYNYAAALLVYMVTSMLWTFVESALMKKVLGPIDPNVAALTPQQF
jgi:YidC/Oxa1 family membrane protein insertase